MDACSIVFAFELCYDKVSNLRFMRYRMIYAHIGTKYLTFFFFFFFPLGKQMLNAGLE